MVKSGNLANYLTRYQEVKMEAKSIEGESLAKKLKGNLKEEIKVLESKGINPSLVAVMVGEDPGAKIYAKNQEKACLELGIPYFLKQLPESTSQADLSQAIKELNENRKTTGIILQMPVPSQINAREVQLEISPGKDVEGIHPANVGKLLYGSAKLAPCTALAAIELLKSTGVPLKGKEVTIVGHSEIVGKPVLLMLLESLLEAPTPTVCHIATQDLKFHTQRADILIVAVGKAGLITGEMIKEGAIVIDIGINRIVKKDQDGNPILNEKGKPKKKIVGDVVFEEARQKASWITPVPGGVGPMTTAMLLKNTVEAAKIQSSSN